MNVQDAASATDGGGMAPGRGVVRRTGKTSHACAAFRLVSAAVVVALATTVAADDRDADASTRFTVTFDQSIADAFTGRVYVALTTAAGFEPRLRRRLTDRQPLYALDVESWKPGTPLVFTGEALGVPPLDTLEDDAYFIQAVMRRNLDTPWIGSGEGDAFSDVVKHDLGGRSGENVALRINQVAGPDRFEESDRVKLLEIRSGLLSRFHGREVNIRAAVVLPPGYADAAAPYPALYFIGGFGSNHTLAPRLERLFARLPGADRICLVVPDPLCRTGHSVFADSANNGPWGRAFVEELIPALEQRFNLVAAPGGRFLTGVSSGGWSSLWLQVTRPDVFDGVWSLAPDPIDFRAFQEINLYEPGANAYVDAQGRRRPLMRWGERVVLWYDDFARMDEVIGEGGQLGSFEAVFSPRGADGRPAPVFDRRTGAINSQVAAAWKPYDIRLMLQENWATLGPQLAGKLNIFVGEQDNFFLDGAVELTRDWLESVGADAVVEVQPDRNHMNILNRVMAARIVSEVLARASEH